MPEAISSKNLGVASLRDTGVWVNPGEAILTAIA
jgi:hypothetical protein